MAEQDNTFSLQVKRLHVFLYICAKKLFLKKASFRKTSENSFEMLFWCVTNNIKFPCCPQV